MTLKTFLRPFVIGVTAFGITSSVSAEELGDLDFASSSQIDVSNSFDINPNASFTDTANSTSNYAIQNNDIRLTQIIGTQTVIGQLLSEKQF